MRLNLELMRKSIHLRRLIWGEQLRNSRSTSLLTSCRGKSRSAQLRTSELNKRGTPNGFDFCYKSSILDISKKSRFDIHIFTWHRCKLSLGNLQLLRHRAAEDLQVN